jgi:hypothetical protein
MLRFQNDPNLSLESASCRATYDHFNCACRITIKTQEYFFFEPGTSSLNFPLSIVRSSPNPPCSILAVILSEGRRGDRSGKPALSVVEWEPAS